MLSHFIDTYSLQAKREGEGGGEKVPSLLYLSGLDLVLFVWKNWAVLNPSAQGLNIGLDVPPEFEPLLSRRQVSVIQKMTYNKKS